MRLTAVHPPNKARRLLLASVVLLALAALVSSRPAAATGSATAVPASAGTWDAMFPAAGFQGFGIAPGAGLYLGPGGLLSAKPPAPISPFFP